MSSYTQEQIKEFRVYYKSLNQEQLDWIKHKCNWEHMSVLAVVNNYRGHIDSLAAQSDPKRKANT